MGSINIVGGGLDVQGIVDQLIYVERSPIRRMQTKTTSLQSKVSAFQSLNTKLGTLLEKVNTVLFNDTSAPYSIPASYEERFASSVFSSRTADSSNDDVLTATASNGTALGSFSITVSALANARSMASTTFADYGTTLTGTGTLEITVDGTTTTVSIGSGQNTLQGVRDAINEADAGVTASILNVGGASPYRLMITSNETGTEKSFSLVDNLVGGANLSLAQVTAASDATMVVNGVTITKSTNTISDAIEGVTITLHNTSAGNVNLTLEPDTDAMVEAVQAMVSAYNDVMSTINAQSKYDTTNKKAGALSGDSTVRSIQARLQSMITQAVSNNHTSFSAPGQIGLEFASSGNLTLDEDEFREALGDGIAEVAGYILGSANDTRATISDARVAYGGRTDATQDGTYAVAVTTLAEQASVTGSRTITTLNQAETLTITYNGIITTASLSNGDSLATVITKINAALDAKGAAVTAENDGSNRLRIRTDAYGSARSVTVVSSRSNASGSTGIGTTPLTDSGVDIAGTIDGHAAVGSGLVLTGANGQAEEGLSLTIAQTVAGSYGTVTIASLGESGNGPLIGLQSEIDGITDPLEGPIYVSTDALNDTIAEVNKRISEYEARLETRREMLLREFSRADEALRLLSVAQNSLSNQVASLSRF